MATSFCIISPSETYGQTQFVTSPDSIQIADEVHGEGTPVLVFIHGWSCARSYWKDNWNRSPGIRIEVGIHSLRHSFATHLVDKGNDLRYIKDILGHFSIKTIERYLHVSKKQLVNIVSPLDDLWRKGGLEW